MNYHSADIAIGGTTFLELPISIIGWHGYINSQRVLDATPFVLLAIQYLQGIEVVEEKSHRW